MRKDAVSSDFAMVVATAVMVFTSLLSLVWLPVVQADRPAETSRPDRHTNEYVGSLNPEQRLLLQESIQRSFYRSSSKDDNGRRTAVPEYQLYYSIFQEILLQPLLAASLSEQDLELIRTLPVHNDRNFVLPAQQALADACRVVETSNAASGAAVNIAAGRFSQAQRMLERELNGHYRAALQRLSDAGRALVDSEYDKLLGQGSLVYAELDIEALGFTQPEFVFAFLQDSCANAERVYAELVTDRITLQEQLEDDYRKGAVQLFPNQ